MTQKEKAKKEKPKPTGLVRVVRSDVAADYGRQVFQAGGLLGQLPRQQQVAVALMARAYGLDPLSGDVLILGTVDRPCLYITAQAWKKRLVGDPRFNGWIEDRIATPEEAKLLGFSEGVVWFGKVTLKGLDNPIWGWGQADDFNVGIGITRYDENRKKTTVTDQRTLVRMAQKRCYMDIAQKAVAFAIDPDIWRGADLELRRTARRLAVAVDDGIMDVDEQVEEAQARAMDVDPLDDDKEVKEVPRETRQQRAKPQVVTLGDVMNVDACGNEVEDEGVVYRCTEEKGHKGQHSCEHEGQLVRWANEAVIDPTLCPECGKKEGQHEKDCPLA